MAHIRVRRVFDGVEVNHDALYAVPIERVKSILDDHALLPGSVRMITVVVDRDDATT